MTHATTLSQQAVQKMVHTATLSVQVLQKVVLSVQVLQKVVFKIHTVMLPVRALSYCVFLGDKYPLEKKNQIFFCNQI